MVAHFTADTFGGVGSAVVSLHRGLLAKGIQSRVYYDKGTCSDLSSFRKPVVTNTFRRWKAEFAVGLRHRLARPALSIFSSPRSIRDTPMVFFGPVPQVVNLHWISRWLDLPSFLHSLPKSLPIVWSLHDMSAFTGGCHLAGNCDRFEGRCGYCPQLRFSWRYDASARFQSTKARIYAGRSLHIVGNSSWTTHQAKKSSLFNCAASFRTIHLGVDPDLGSGLDRSTSRAALGLPQNDFIIGFGSVDLNDPNKNLSALCEALDELPSHRATTLLLFGGGTPRHLPKRIPTVNLGVLSASRLKRIFYSALDVLAMPSFMETFGLTALEAMACSTPAVAFAVGGIPDFLQHNVTGLLAGDPGDTGSLMRCLEWLRTHPADARQLGRAAQEAVAAQFSLSLMSDRYAQLYDAVLADTQSVAV